MNFIVSSTRTFTRQNGNNLSSLSLNLSFSYCECKMVCWYGSERSFIFHILLLLFFRVIFFTWWFTRNFWQWRSNEKSPIWGFFLQTVSEVNEWGPNVGTKSRFIVTFVIVKNRRHSIVTCIQHKRLILRHPFSLQWTKFNTHKISFTKLFFLLKLSTMRKIPILWAKLLD